jgi:hypothetical protein
MAQGQALGEVNCCPERASKPITMTGRPLYVYLRAEFDGNLIAELPMPINLCTNASWTVHDTDIRH